MITHAGDTVAAHPPDEVVGQWGSNASCVVVDPNFVLTTRHQGGGVGTTVTVAGVSYIVAEAWNYDSNDLRLAWIKRADNLAANLEQFVAVYDGSSEIGQAVAIGGWGKGAGATLMTTGSSPVAYGYGWSGSSNTTQRWGGNTVNAALARLYTGPYQSKALRADFDPVGLGGWVAGEAGLAEWDSGGGWFMPDDDGAWSVVGLNAGAEVYGQTRFANPVTGLPDGDDMFAVRVSRYAYWIDEVIAGFQLPGDVNDDAGVNLEDLGILASYFGSVDASRDCGDLNGDRLVDLTDLGLLVTNFGVALSDPSQTSAVSVPEPASAALLVCGAAAMLARRRRA